MTNPFSAILLLIGLTGCSIGGIQPLPDLNNSLLKSANSHREPSLGQLWLATLANHKGKDRIELIDLRNRRTTPLPGLNRPDSQPISVSVSANGDLLALIRQRESQTELLLYRRRFGTLQRLSLGSRGIPRQVSIDGSGRVLAVQVSRDGKWEIDLLRLSG